MSNQCKNLFVVALKPHRLLNFGLLNKIKIIIISLNCKRDLLVVFLVTFTFTLCFIFKCRNWPPYNICRVAVTLNNASDCRANGLLLDYIGWTNRVRGPIVPVSPIVRCIIKCDPCVVYLLLLTAMALTASRRMCDIDPLLVEVG